MKKLGKLLIFGAAIGSAAAATYYYLAKKDANLPLAEEDEDFDAFDEDIFEDETQSDNEKHLNEHLFEEDDDFFEDDDDFFDETIEDASIDSETEDFDSDDFNEDSEKAFVEEFFDDDDEDEL